VIQLLALSEPYCGYIPRPPSGPEGSANDGLEWPARVADPRSGRAPKGPRTGGLRLGVAPARCVRYLVDPAWVLLGVTARRDGGQCRAAAAWRLVWALSTLKGEDERIRIPGFYDGIKPPSTRDRELMEALPEVAEEYKSRYGVRQFIKGLTGGTELKIEEVFTPTCTICGLTSGYQGPGSKTVLPARASAKVDFRLVPDQHPDDILKKLRSHLDAEGFSDIQITDLGGDPPARTDPDEPFIQLVTKTSEEVYQAPMQLVPMVGGSGPSYPFVHDLKLPIATAGLGYPDTRAHAPNENIRVDLYLKHARHMARILKEFAK